MIITDNPIRDFEEWDAEQAQKLKDLPRCDICKNPIQDDYYYEIGSDYICLECMDNYYRRTNF